MRERATFTLSTGQQEIFDAVRAMIDELSHVQPPVTVDHIWLYFDNEHEPATDEETVH